MSASLDFFRAKDSDLKENIKTKASASEVMEIISCIFAKKIAANFRKTARQEVASEINKKVAEAVRTDRES